MIDEDSDGLINFKEFSLLCGLISRGDLHERLKLLYKMHLSCFDEGTSSTPLSPQKELFDVVENASEVTEGVDESDLIDEETMVVVPSKMGVEGKLEDQGVIVMTPTRDVLEENLWPQTLRESADLKDGQGGSDSPPDVPDASRDVRSGRDSTEPSDSVVQGAELSPRDVGVERPLSPNTTKYILSKSPKSAKKLVKDFVASVMKDENRVEELPNMSQV